MQLNAPLAITSFPNKPHSQRFSQPLLHFPLRLTPAPSNFLHSAPENRCFRLLVSASASNVDHLETRNEKISDSESDPLFDDTNKEQADSDSSSNSNTKGALAEKSIWAQMKEIVLFSGLATGIWICAPLMSLISTAIVGRGSSTELFTPVPFPYVTISDNNEVQQQISILLFVGFTCGALMLLFTQFLAPWAFNAFSGPKNVHIVPAASKYVQIRGLAWPAVLYGLVAQSASLGMKDSWGPLKALLVASSVNGIGHVILCTFLRYGIEGAAWATMASQVVASFMMTVALNCKGYTAFAISVPSFSDFLQIFGIAAPVFVTMFSKVVFYSLITYFATAISIHAIAAHQVMIQMYSMCVVWGEPLSQTAQSFMPELLYGFNRSLKKMHSVLILFFFALSAAPCTHSLEGTLLAGRDLTFISLSMSGCFSIGSLLLLLVSSRGYGLAGCWCALVGFQWARFFLALRRVLSPNGMLYSEEGPYKLEKLKAA